MMKIPLKPLFFMLLFFTVIAKSDNSQREVAHTLCYEQEIAVAGTVKEVRCGILVCREDGGDCVEEPKSYQTVRYTRDGKILEERSQSTLQACVVGKLLRKANEKFVEEKSGSITTLYTLSSQGLISSAVIYAANGKMIEINLFTYEFDWAGNWVKKNRIIRRFFESGETLEEKVSSYRLIEYY